MRVLMLLLALTCLFSCTLEKAKDKSAIKDTVMRYNTGLAYAARSGDMKPLETIASNDVLRKLYYWRAAWADSNYYMDGTLKDIKFTTMDITGQTAKAVTTENWVYTYRNLTTKQIVVPETKDFYEMEYDLQKKDGAWTITNINIKSEKEDHK